MSTTNLPPLVRSVSEPPVASRGDPMTSRTSRGATSVRGDTTSQSVPATARRTVGPPAQPAAGGASRRLAALNSISTRQGQIVTLTPMAPQSAPPALGATYVRGSGPFAVPSVPRPLNFHDTPEAWRQQYRSEQESCFYGLELAQRMFRRLMHHVAATNPTCGRKLGASPDEEVDSAVAAGDSKKAPSLDALKGLLVPASMKNNATDAIMGSRPTPLRTAVSSLLLEQLSAAFPRYRGVLDIITRVIIESIYVPDTAPHRLLLGSLHAPLADRSSMTQPSSPFSPSSPRSPSSFSSNDFSQLQPDAAELQLLRPYERKTFAQAYDQLHRELHDYLLKNRSVEVKLSRQVRIFDVTLGHWVKTLKRTFFTAWKNFTNRRRQLRRKYRAVFHRVRSDECKLKAIRRWKDRAVTVKKAAIHDASQQQELALGGVTVEQLHADIATLADQNVSLSQQIAAVEEEKTTLLKELNEKEITVTAMKRRIVEIEQTGSELLDSVLQRWEPPTVRTGWMAVVPRGGARGNAAASPGMISANVDVDPLEALVVWAHAAVEYAGGAPSGDKEPFSKLIREDEDVLGLASIEQPNWDAFGCVLAALVPDKAPSRATLAQWHVRPYDETIPAQVVHAFVGATGRASLVTAQQLATRHRGILLLFLASMLRFAVHWSLCKPMKFPPYPRVIAIALIGGAAGAVDDAIDGLVDGDVDGLSSLEGGDGTRPSFAKKKHHHLIINHATPTHAASVAAAKGQGTRMGVLPPPMQSGATPVIIARDGQIIGSSAEAWALRVNAQQQWILFGYSAVSHALRLALVRPPQWSPEEIKDLPAFFSEITSLKPAAEATSANTASKLPIGLTARNPHGVDAATNASMQFLQGRQPSAVLLRVLADNGILPSSAPNPSSIASATSMLRALQRNYLDLRKVFKLYAASAGGPSAGTMASGGSAATVGVLFPIDFMKMLRDARLLHVPAVESNMSNQGPALLSPLNSGGGAAGGAAAGTITKARLEQLFAETLISQSTTAVASKPFSGSDPAVVAKGPVFAIASSAIEITAGKFMELMVRVMLLATLAPTSSSTNASQQSSPMAANLPLGEAPVSNGSLVMGGHSTTGSIVGASSTPFDVSVEKAAQAVQFGLRMSLFQYILRPDPYHVLTPAPVKIPPTTTNTTTTTSDSKIAGAGGSATSDNSTGSGNAGATASTTAASAGDNVGPVAGNAAARERFRYSLRQPQVQAVLLLHKISLRRIFHRFADADNGEGMTRVGLQSLARAGQWGGRLITSDAILDVFRRCATTVMVPPPQQMLASQVPATIAMEVLGLNEFTEAICAIACFDHPSPFTPLAVKVSAFMEDRVVRLLSDG